MTARSLNQMRSWYTRIAPVYDLVCRPLYLRPRRYALRAMNLVGGERVLEIGCGTGLNLPLLGAAVGEQGRVLGLEVTEAMSRSARKRVRRCGMPQVEVLNCNLLEPSPDAMQRILTQHLGAPQADAILCSHLFTIAPQWRKLFARGWKLLRPGGIFVIVDTRPLQGGWRWLNPMLMPLADWSGHGDMHRPTWTLLGSGPDTGMRSFLGGFVSVSHARKGAAPN